MTAYPTPTCERTYECTARHDCYAHSVGALDCPGLPEVPPIHPTERTLTAMEDQ